MKKRLTSLFLTLALALTMTATALAAGTDNTPTIKGFNGAMVSFAEGSNEKIEVTYTGLQAGEQYLVLMLSDSKANPETDDVSKYETPVPTVDNILYIDQKAADDNGSISFEVYPKSLSTGVILITGVDRDGKPQKLVAAIVKAKFILGDVDGDGVITTTDAAQVLRRVALLEVTDFNEAAADLDGIAGISASDAAMILRITAGLENLS